MAAATVKSVQDDLRVAMIAAGVDPGAEPIYHDGRIHRYRGPTDKEKDSWYVAFESGITVFGNWRLDIRETAVPNGGSNGHTLTGLELKQVEEARRAAEAERQWIHAQAAVKARKLYEAATPLVGMDDHPYLRA
jgi:hypothetical protein